MAASPKSNIIHGYVLKKDTIIQLDSTKDQKLIKGKKSKATSGTKSAVVKKDTTKKK